MNKYLPFWELENFHEGKPIAICGNGPSLAEVPDEFFKKHVTMACNSVYASGYFANNTPDWYVIEGAGHLKRPEERASRVEYLEKIGQQGNHACINRRFAHHFQHLPVKMYFIDYLDYRGTPFQSFQFDPFLNYGTGHCVTYAMLQLAYFLTDGPVLLVGLDHKFDDESWHFYKDEDAPAFHSMPKDKYVTFRQRVDPKFEEVAQVYRVTNRTLLNLTEGSAAKMFESDKLENWL